MPPILQLRNLCRRTAVGAWLLREISVDVFSGQRIACHGPSGSGKTLLLRCLAMLDPFDSGELRWRQDVVSGNMVPRFRSQCIYLHQRLRFADGSVQEIIDRPLRFQQHKSQTHDPAMLIEWLDVVGRDSRFLQKSSTNLSGGEQQIVALLRAMQLRPTVMLLDEPTAALDAAAAQRIERLIQLWQDQDPEHAYVWVTHDERQSARISDVHWQMQDGRLLEGSA